MRTTQRQECGTATSGTQVLRGEGWLPRILQAVGPERAVRHCWCSCHFRVGSEAQEQAGVARLAKNTQRQGHLWSSGSERPGQSPPRTPSCGVLQAVTQRLFRALQTHKVVIVSNTSTIFTYSGGCSDATSTHAHY